MTSNESWMDVVADFCCCNHKTFPALQCQRYSKLKEWSYSVKDCLICFNTVCLEGIEKKLSRNLYIQSPYIPSYYSWLQYVIIHHSCDVYSIINSWYMHKWAASPWLLTLLSLNHNSFLLIGINLDVAVLMRAWVTARLSEFSSNVMFCWKTEATLQS